MFGFDEGEFGAEEGGEMMCSGYGVEDLGLVDGVGWEEYRLDVTFEGGESGVCECEDRIRNHWNVHFCKSSVTKIV